MLGANRESVHLVILDNVSISLSFTLVTSVDTAISKAFQFLEKSRSFISMKSHILGALRDSSGLMQIKAITFLSNRLSCRFNRKSNEFTISHNL